MRVDLKTLLSWIVPGLIGLVAGAVGSLLTHRFQLRRDELETRRDLEQQLQERMRAELLKGLDDPGKAIKGLRELRERLRRESAQSHLTHVVHVDALPLVERLAALMDDLG